MRNLIALIACCFVIATADAADPPVPPEHGVLKPIATIKPNSPSASASASSSASSASSSSASASGSAMGKGRPPVLSQREREDQAEAELSAKIAARLAIMRANQAARVAAQAKAKKAAAVVAATPPPPPPPRHGTHWAYEGEDGPANWSKVNVDWAKCGNGTRQSPIDIRDGMKVDLEQITFDYHPSSFTVTDNLGKGKKKCWKVGCSYR